MLDKFIIYIEEMNALKELKDEEMGIFFRAMISFAETGKVPPLPEKLLFVFRLITAHIERDHKKYMDVCEKRRIAGKKGGEATREKRKAEQASQASEDFSTPDKYSKDSEKPDTDICSKDSDLKNKDESNHTDASDSNKIQKQETKPNIQTQFEEFWKSYPKKKNQRQARKEYERLNPSMEKHREIMDSLEKQKKSNEWKIENGRYIPFPARWLSDRRWEDIIEPPNSNIYTAESFTVDEFVMAALKKQARLT